MNMKLLGLLPVVLLATACGSANMQQQVQADARTAVKNVLGDLARQRSQGVDTRAHTFSCSGLGNVVVSYRLPENTTTMKAIVTLDNGRGKQYNLSEAMSASGERYSNGNTHWWSKGNTGLLTVEGGRESACRLIKLS